MNQSKTVLIVGAGASGEVGLPTNDELKATIARYLDIRYQFELTPLSGDRTIAAALNSYGDVNQYLRACWQIRDALPQAMSIDNFIDAHRGNQQIELCGKLAIVRSILEAERNSRLYVSQTNVNNKLKYDSIAKTWFNVFWQRISENCQAEQLAERLSSIVFIVFNYDRCIEHFLYHAIQNYYSLDDNVVSALIREMKIFHPYGTVGSLPWTNGAAKMPFGGEPRATDLVRLATQIKTFTEGVDPESSDVEEIRSHVAQASTLVFLGFAYHKQNLELLRQTVDRECSHHSATDCYGTTVGISEPDLEVITSEIRDYCGALLHPNDDRHLTCHELFNTYRRTLSFV